MKKAIPSFARVLLAFAVVFLPFTPSVLPQDSYMRFQDAPFLSFDDLRALSMDPTPKGTLKDRLEKFWKTPLISNEAYYNGARPEPKASPEMGPYLRIATWNIEKSYHIPEAIEAFTSSEKFQRQIDPLKAPEGSKKWHTVMDQQQKLMGSDIIFLQEMDIGIKRSGYIDAPRELAKALNMNYAFAAEQLEVDPVMLGLEDLYYDNKSPDKEATDYYRVDAAKEKGAFGVAVLSRYPIKKAECFQLDYQAYHWYTMEKQKAGFLEISRRFGAKTVLKNEVTREMKVGGRIYFRVDLEVPGIPGNTLTLINIHLEIKCLPKAREQQMREILSYIRDIKNPVIVAGDFNAAPTDISATSLPRVIKRTAKNPTTWFAVGVNYLTPHGLIINSTRTVSNMTKNFQDPLSKNISVVAPNPVYGLFKEIEDFRFSDGGAFDFRGDKERSVNGKHGKLSNSNQRDRKGFKTSFSVKRPIGPFGKYRLDWIFVKSVLKDPLADAGSYKLSPHFGETLEEMNTSLRQPISDHHPSIAILPLEEPKIKKS
ncbi:MAG TPA: endonuclease/exonuclease/phosphatase family protein [Verrucomicrobiae bacterium]|nr:endonuclease/exonuclease/phosphatase family protein [Verrucomicrobiae bacterium]